MTSFPIQRAAEFVKTEGSPRFEATVPRQFTHKRAVEETFLTDVIVDLDRERVLACAQLPRSHTLHNEVENGLHDLLLILEIGRQGMTIYGHVRLEIDKETAFVMSGLRVAVIDLEAMRQSDGPAELVFDVPFGRERRNRRGRVRGYDLSGIGSIDGRPALQLFGEATLIPEALYERVRTVRVDGWSGPSADPTPVDPTSLGRSSLRNVVVGDAEHDSGELRCTLVTVMEHPSFFDHPLDHVPGMMMMEAARQAAVLFVGGLGWPPERAVLDGCHARFVQYAALTPPAYCRVRRRDGPAIDDGSFGGDRGVEHLRAAFSQAGTDLGHVDLRLRRIAE